MLQHVRCHSFNGAKKAINHSKDNTRPDLPVMTDDELRRQILGMSRPRSTSKPVSEPTSLTDAVNASVLFPSPASPHPSSDFEIVLAMCPVCTSDGRVETPAHYAMLVRQGPTGEYIPLLKGEAYSRSAAWSQPLRGLFEASAKAIHLYFAGSSVPLPGQIERLPRYEPQTRVTQ